MLNRKEAPQQHSIQDIDLIEPEILSFENGLKVLVFRAEEQALIKAEFVFDNLFAAKENPLLSTCLSSMLKEGTTSRSSAQIADDVDFYGAYLVPEYSYDHSSLTLYSLQKYVAQVLPVVQDVLVDAIFPEAELATYIRNNKQSLQVSMRKNDYVARKRFYNALFGATRYGITPSEEAYDSLNRADLLSLYQKQVQPKNCTLILSGGVTDEILNLIQDLFVRNWQNTDNISLSTAPSLPEFEGGLHMEERDDALQSAIRIGIPSINRTHPDFPALQFVNTLFGGYFGSRLMRNIREEKGYTYSIGSALASLRYGGFFTLATEVGVDVTADALKEIEHEFNTLTAELAPAEEVELVKNYMLGTMLGSLESIFSHADKYKSAYFYGLDLTYYKRYTNTIREMSPAKVQEIAKQYFQYDKMYKVVVGKL